MTSKRMINSVSQPESQTKNSWNLLWVFVFWVLTRAVIVYEAMGVQRSADGDIRYYHRQMAPLFHTFDVRHILVEYPLPIFAFLWPIDLITDGAPRAFNILFASFMLVIDAMFTAYVAYTARRQGSSLWGTWFWLAFGLFFGPVLILRFDLIPSFLVAIFIVTLRQKPTRAGAALALAAAMKLWPLALAPFVLPLRDSRKKFLLSTASCGTAIVICCLMWAGEQRLVSPLTWQKDRGLQIESVFASPLIVARAINSDRWRAIFSHGAVEVVGPGVKAAEQLSTACFVIAFVVLCGFVLLRWHQITTETSNWIFLLTIALLIITNKTLSVQYIIWLAAPAAVLLPVSRHKRTAFYLAGSLLLIAALSQLEYPIKYGDMWPNQVGTVGLTALVVRNILLLLWTGCLALNVVRSMRSKDVAGFDVED